MEAIIALNYSNPLHPASFRGIDAQRRFYGRRVSLNVIKRGLASVRFYNVSLRPPKVSTYNIVYNWQGAGKKFEIDLADVSLLSKDNRGVTFLLCIIDTFSRHLSVYPLRNKKPESVALRFRQFLSEKENSGVGAGNIAISSDRGGEFRGAFRELMREKGITHTHPSIGSHCYLIERSIAGLKRAIFLLLKQQQSNNYLGDLAQLVDNYNSSHHRSLNMSPREASKKENESSVIQFFLESHGKRALKARRLERRRKEKSGAIPVLPGTPVLLQSDRSVFAKGFDDYFNSLPFIVSEVDTSLLRPTFRLVHGPGEREGERFPRRVYREQITPLHLEIGPDSFPAHRVSDSRRRKVIYDPPLTKPKAPKHYVISDVFVEFENYPDYSTWMPKSFYLAFSQKRKEGEVNAVGKNNPTRRKKRKKRW